MDIHSVSDVTGYIRDLLDEDDLLSDIWVSGEVSNLSESAAGHMYFTLKDESSQLRCVLFNSSRLAVSISNGMAAVAHGHISIYEVSGALQLYVDVVQPEGVGALHLEFERLKTRLEGEGLFDPSRKRPLPAFPRRIAVITSPDGAALRDIINVVGRRYPLAELLVCPTPVQGDMAVPGIVRAFEALNRADSVDVVILARGGGSLEDLWAFNDEAVARAIYACRAPVVSGVGHETDYTIADFVADMRAPTPSAAAELAVPSSSELQAHLRSLARSLESLLSGRIERFRQRIDELNRAAATYLTSRLAIAKEKFRAVELELMTLSPLATLERGYAIVQRADSGEVVSRIEQVSSGDCVQVMVSDGRFAGQVTEV